MPCTCYAKPLAWPSESNCQVSWSHWSQWSMFSWMANMAVKRELCFPKSTGSLFACLNVHRARDACAVRHLSNYHSRFQLKRRHWHLAHSRVPPRVLWSLLLRYVSMFPEPLLCETLWHVLTLCQNSLGGLRSTCLWCQPSFRTLSLPYLAWSGFPILT